MLSQPHEVAAPDADRSFTPPLVVPPRDHVLEAREVRQRFAPLVAATAASYGLPGLRLDRHLNLHGGRLALRLSDAWGRAYLLHHHDPAASPQDYRHQQAIMLHVCRHGLPVPNLIAMPNGATTLAVAGESYELQAWVEGVNFVYDSPTQVASAARTLGKLHRISEQYAGETNYWPEQWSMLGQGRARLNRLSHYVAALRDPADRQRADAALDQIADAHSLADRRIAAAAPHLRLLHIHGNYHGYNLTFNRRGEVTTVRGWDSSRYAPRLLELAQALLYFSVLIFSGGGQPELRPERQANARLFDLFLSEYQSECKLSIIERDLLAAALTVAWPFVLAETLLESLFYPEEYPNQPPISSSMVALTLHAAAKVSRAFQQIQSPPELAVPNNARPDGRAATDLRAIKITTNYQVFPTASVLVEFGRTQVICAVTAETDLPPHRVGKGGWVTAEYSMLPSATPGRNRREASTGKVSGRTQEIQRLIGRSLRGITDLVALGDIQLTVDCDVINADGGTRTAAITGSYVALALAVDKLRQAHRVGSKRILLEPLAAISVGIVAGEARLDLAYEEDSRAEVDFNVVQTGSGKYIEVQGTAEGKPFDRAALDQLLNLADKGLAELFAIQQATLKAAGVGSR